MRFGVLGQVSIWTADGVPVKIPGLKVRALLAALLLYDGGPVPADRLVDHLWGDDLPGDPAAALAVKVSQLRRVLEEAEPGGRRLLASPPPGYRLDLRPHTVDAREFHELVARAREVDDPERRATLLTEALALWRGGAYTEFSDQPFTGPTIARLEEERLVAQEVLARARLELGEDDLVIAELGELLAEHPLREQPRALHMLALYRSGRQSDALESFQTVRRQLAEELGLDPGAELLALQQAILTQDLCLDQPTARATRPGNNLPTPVTQLVGREDAVAEIQELLALHRLVTVSGTGGVGKTRLALEVAAEQAVPFADGVWFVELASFDRAAEPDALESLADVVMAVLEIHDSAAAGRRPTSIQRLAQAVRSREMLLVLDNCEHVLGPVADLINLLLGAAPRLRILTTSREPVGLAGEVVRPVPPLEVPSAVQLFVLRAAAAAHGFELTAGNADEVAQICRRLDGVPLALELAATRVRTLGLRGLIDGLDDRFRLLAVGRRGVPSRQRTLMATIDWSWQLLTTEEQTVLRRLAVHADGCTREGAEALCPVADLSEILAGLVDRSLVVLSDSGVDGARYRLLESVAAFCVDRLQEQGELQGLREQHRQYYAELALRAEPKLYGPDQDRWLRVLDAENANLRAALDGATQTGDAESALGLVNAMAWYWFLRGRLAEAARSIQAALGVIGRTTPTARGRALVWHTGISFLLGDTADWAARHTAALRSPVVSDDPRNRARGEWFLAFAQIDLGEVAATGKLIDELLTRFRDLGDEWGEAATLALRAKHAHITGDIDRLEEDGFRSTELSRRLGDRWCLLQATEWLGASAALRGNYEQAVELQREGLRMAEELGLWAEVSGRLCWLGWIAMQRGDYRNALELCTKGLRLAREQASPLGVVFAQLGLAFAARRNGDLAAAEIHLHELLGTAVAADGQPLYLPSVLIELGYLAELRGDPAAATERHTEAFAVAKQLGAARDIAQALAGLAGAIARAGDAYQAAVLLGAAAAAREAAQADLAPAEELDHARAVTAAQSTLGLDAFATAFDRGRSLSPDEAIGVTPAVNKP